MRLLFKLLCCVWIVSFVNCKEDKDDVFPQVSITTPSENTSYNVLDFVGIKAEVSDNKNIESVRVSLISDATKNQIVPSKTVTVNQKQYSVNEVFELSDSLLETGRYYFRVEAFDGENYFSAFRFITINGIDKKKLGVVVSCKNGTQTDIYSDKDDSNFQLLTSLIGNYQASVLNSSDQNFWFAPSNNDVLSAYSFTKNSIVYSNRYLSNFSAPFSDLKLEDRDVLIGLTKGEVDGRSQFFSDSYTYLAQSERKVGSIAVSDNYVLVEEVDNAGTNRSINILRRTSGAVVSSTVFNEDVVEMVFTEKDKCIVLANNTQGGRGVAFDLSTGTILNTMFRTDSIRSVVETNRGNLVIATSLGVDFYTVQNGSLVTYLNKANAVLGYDELNNLIYVGTGNRIDRYSYPTTNGSGTLLPNEIVGIDIRYNRD